MTSVRALLYLLALAAPLRADVTLIGVASTPGTASDLSGLNGKTADGTPHNRLGGHGSGIAYTGKGTEYVLVSDRGPADGASDFADRFHRVDIRVAPGAKQPVTLTLTATTLLTSEAGKRLVGSLTAFKHALPEKNLRFDPEGVRVGRGGTLFISDEYGPCVYEFDAKGKRVRSLPVPEHFRAAEPGQAPPDELPPKNTIGRQPNRGMEGLAISPDGAKLYGIMQSPLIQDGALKGATRVGVNCRILEIDTATNKTREFVYPLESASHGVNEIVAVGGGGFLVLERDGEGGADAKCKKLYRIDTAGATDVSGVKSLPTGALPASIKPVQKALFLDLLDKKFGIAGASCPEKFEGLAFGPDLPDGRRLLLVTVDNDFIADKPSVVYAFAVDSPDLPNFRPQGFGGKK